MSLWMVISGSKTFPPQYNSIYTYKQGSDTGHSANSPWGTGSTPPLDTWKDVPELYQHRMFQMAMVFDYGVWGLGRSQDLMSGFDWKVTQNWAITCVRRIKVLDMEPKYCYVSQVYVMLFTSLPKMYRALVTAILFSVEQLRNLILDFVGKAEREYYI